MIKFLALSVFIWALSACAPSNRYQFQHVSVLNKLSTGMSKEQVLSIMGENPGAATESDPWSCYQYRLIKETSSNNSVATVDYAIYFLRGKLYKKPKNEACKPAYEASIREILSEAEESKGKS